MIFVEIVMIVVGMAAVIYSYRIADNSSQNQNEAARKAMHVIDMDTTEQMKQQLVDYQQKVEDIASDAEIQTEEKLQNLSNESILGISEYSDQVLDKIEKNHAEVVFLYNMLNEKQDELKELIGDSDKIKAELRDEIAVLYQEHQDWVKTAMDELQDMTDQCKEEIAESYVIPESQISMQDEFEPELEGIFGEDDIPQEEAISLSPEKTDDSRKEEGFNKQAEILDLYKKGHTVLEISKLLSIGQGEVSFVIGLYG